MLSGTMNQCPTCDHKVERMSDYPILHIESVSRTPIPEYIGALDGFVPTTKVIKNAWGFFLFGTKMVDNPDIPPRVFEELRSGKKDVFSFEGKIYRTVDGYPNVYNISKDMTAEVHEVLRDDFVGRSLATLESMVGKDIPTKEFRDELLIGSTLGSTFDVGAHKDGRLQLYDKSQTEDSVSRGASLRLESGFIYGICENTTLLSLELATFQYHGKFRV